MAFELGFEGLEELKDWARMERGAAILKEDGGNILRTK